MIGGLVLFLIFSPQLTKSSDLKTKNPETEQPNNPDNSTSDNQDNNQTNDEEKEEIFASKIKLNCEDNIILSVGSSVELLSGYINVEPAKYLADITTSLSVESGAINGISFVNNVITAKAVGRYEIMFSVPKTINETINDKIYIQVVEKEDDNKVRLLNNNFTNQTTVSLSEVIDIDGMFNNYSIVNTEYLTFSNNQITFNAVGSSNLNLSVEANYLVYKYSFWIKINSKITSTIDINGEDNGILEVTTDEFGFFDINFFVKKESGEFVKQNAYVIPENDGVIEILEVLPPYVTCRCITKTNIKLTIIPTDTSIPSKEILIVFK